MTNKAQRKDTVEINLLLYINNTKDGRRDACNTSRSRFSRVTLRF